MNILGTGSLIFFLKHPQPTGARDRVHDHDNNDYYLYDEKDHYTGPDYYYYYDYYRDRGSDRGRFLPEAHFGCVQKL